jgi:elongation factor 2
MKLEQNRQMTIRGANVTLFYESEGKEYVINMIDTPGHIDFTGRVTRALRAIDGVVVVSDSVEGIMTQTETVTRQALEERVRPVLYINKIDRLVKELRLDATAMQKWLSNIIAEFNKLVDIYAEPELKEKWKVSIQGNSVAFGSAKDRWGFNFKIAQKRGVSFKDVYDAYTSNDQNVLRSLAEKAPLHEAVLGMVVQHHPPPHVAQRYRIPKIWQGNLESEVGRSILGCDEKGPAVMMVTTINVDPQAGRIATGRLFSGTIKDGDEVYLIDAKRSGKIQSVNIYMGNTREVVGMLPSGNIPALLGLDYAVAGETIATVKNIPPFESIKYVSEPVVTIAVEPKHPKDLPKLVKHYQTYGGRSNLIVKISEETGETLMAGMICILNSDVSFARLVLITTTQPLINYRKLLAGRSIMVISNKNKKSSCV